MPIAESEVTWVDEPKLGLWEQLYVPALIDGIKTTVSHMFGKKMTEQYPEQEPKLPANYRGVHRLNVKPSLGDLVVVYDHDRYAAHGEVRTIDVMAVPGPLAPLGFSVHR